ncbi:hypothetical protein THASP1DRAFT_27493 [Thamnocephalis sphaerospora]|uniref:F-box domain-containing protein n=1 Tax=Thamnocephalis sphaerospora TaxID=78915 RepID=A0A4V1IXE1_9FUNG|nr:hypothetical protein THASP1DRAFT_27493 [Thamnocephalis sphaerospora]|eukprot:RKP10739.1 hypothetical protein THASP1DRAFT_27493 [Thamnocephalis sphaerospora]
MNVSSLEGALSRLPFDVQRVFLQALRVQDALSLSLASRALYATVVTNKAYWRYAYVETFLGGDQYGAGEGVDEKEEAWLERTLAPSLSPPTAYGAYMLSMPPPSARVSRWFAIYARRARLDLHWRAGMFKTRTFAMPAPMGTPTRPATCPSRIIPFQSPFGCVLVKWDKLFWVSGAPAPYAVELLLEGSPAESELELEPEPEAPLVCRWAATCVQSATASVDEVEYPDWRVLVWAIPTGDMTQMTAKRATALSPYLTLPLGPKSSGISVRGPWLLFEKPAQADAGAHPVLLHLPTKTASAALTLASPSTTSPVSEIQTYSDRIMPWCQLEATLTPEADQRPAAAIFSASLMTSENQAVAGVRWQLVQHQLLDGNGNDARTEVLGRGEVSNGGLNVVRLLSLHRVDHTRMLIAFGAVDQCVALVRSVALPGATTGGGEGKPAGLCWTTTFGLKSLHVCPGQNLLLVVLHTDDLVAVSLDSGVTLRRIPGNGPMFVSHISSAFMLHMASGPIDGFLWADDACSKSVSLMNMASDAPRQATLLQLPSNVGGPTQSELGCTQTVATTSSHICWMDDHFHYRSARTGMVSSLGQLAKSLASLASRTVTLVMADFDD